MLDYRPLFKEKPIIYTVGNYKGGVGKTTNTCLIAYSLAKMGIKTLVVDLDAQANATSLLILTKSNREEEVFSISKTLMGAITDGEIKEAVINIVPNLDLIPSGADFSNFSKYVFRNSVNEEDANNILKKTLAPIAQDYDVILLDVPPMNREVTDNASFASDYVIISLQTQEKSLAGALEYINDLTRLKNDYDLPIDVVGILPVLQKTRAKLDEYILSQAIFTFGQDNMFDTVVKPMERIKVWDTQNGISEEDIWDKRVLAVFNEVARELLAKTAYFRNVELVNLITEEHLEKLSEMLLDINLIIEKKEQEIKEEEELWELIRQEEEEARLQKEAAALEEKEQLKKEALEEFNRLFNKEDKDIQDDIENGLEEQLEASEEELNPREEEKESGQ